MNAVSELDGELALRTKKNGVSFVDMTGVSSCRSGGYADDKAKVLRGVKETTFLGLVGDALYILSSQYSRGERRDDIPLPPC